MPSKIPKRIPYPIAVAELVTRDPLYSELVQAIAKSQTVKIKDLPMRLFEKYGRTVFVHVPDPPTIKGLQFRFVDDSQDDALLWTSNILTLASGSHSPHGKFVTEVGFPDPLSENNPSLFVKVNLSRITQWDLERITGHIKALIRKCLPSPGRSGGTDPKELTFLRTIRSDIFYRDLRRYDLHIEHDLSFRLIALLEKLGRAEDTSLQPRRVGLAVSKESSVGDSIPRIYKAIYRTDYKTKRRRLDSPVHEMPTYQCPSHGDNCGLSCSYLKTWSAKFNAISPSALAGSASSLPLESLDWRKPGKRNLPRPQEE